MKRHALSLAANAVRRLPANVRGRDFVLGDVHGSYDLVLAAMQAVAFDKQRDRLFLMGNLVGRGVDALRCARLLAQPYVHGLRGNLDHGLLSLYALGEPEPAKLTIMANMFGHGWWIRESRNAQLEVLQAVGTLPYAIEVNTARGLVGLVHAHVPPAMGWDHFTNLLERGTVSHVEEAMEGLCQMVVRPNLGLLGVGRLFVGNTPVRNESKRLGNIYPVDAHCMLNLLFPCDRLGTTGPHDLVEIDLPAAPPGQAMRRHTLRVIDEVEEGRPFGLHARAQGGPSV
jgi:serine/threonine protein phosphatase 1